MKTISKTEVSKLSRRALLAGGAGTLAGQMTPGKSLAAAAKKWIEPGLWEVEVAALAAAAPFQNPAVEVRTVGGRITLTPPGTGRSSDRRMALNAAGRTIWEACDGKRTVPQIAEQVSRQYDISPNQAYLDCMAFLFHLKLFNAILI